MSEPGGPVTGIRVRIGQPGPEGAPEPRYDRESQILAAEAPVSAEWPLGDIVFDLAADRTLMTFDLHIGECRWTDVGKVDWPSNGRRGVVVFAPEAVATKSFNLPLEVYADRDREFVRIEIGATAGAQPVRLADRCVALVNEDDELAGFVCASSSARQWIGAAGGGATRP